MPFKDILNRNKYHRKKQAEIRKAAKHEIHIQEVRKVMVDEMRRLLVGRLVYPITSLAWENPMSFKGTKYEIPLLQNGEIRAMSRLPVIHKEFCLSSRESLLKAVKLCAQEEDTLLLTGEHKNWDALGIEGLATATGRMRVPSNGNFKEDIKAGIKAMGVERLPYAVIASFPVEKIIKPQLNGVYYYYSPFLFTKEETQDNLIIMKVGVDTCKLIIGSDWDICRGQSEDIFKLYATIAPIILNSNNICEVIDLRY